jgi:hypothetical protein
MDAAGIVTQLGVAGFAIMVIWWMYKDTSQRTDALNKEVREIIMTQLNRNTAAFEQVMEHFAKPR